MAPIEVDRFRFGVGDDTNAAERVTLIEREGQDVAEKRAADAEALGPAIHTEPRKPQNRKRVGGKPSFDSLRRKVGPLHASRRDGCESEQSAAHHGYISDSDVELELILAGVVMEESIEIGLPAREGA
jgi:hypothetical protein